MCHQSSQSSSFQDGCPCKDVDEDEAARYKQKMDDILELDVQQDGQQDDDSKDR